MPLGIEVKVSMRYSLMIVKVMLNNNKTFGPDRDVASETLVEGAIYLLTNNYQ